MATSRQKFLLAAVGLALVVAGISATSLRAGARRPGDHLICSFKVNVRARLGAAVSEIRRCSVPKYNQNITHVSAVDLGKAGRGGYAHINDGGVGKKNVTLFLWSQKSQPLNFTVEVYAWP
ncbi:probable salivary secreted peptide [Copidosoma floridanum]|uniref:probable salivary secreted peptide n=1 Tax=Copidosoma floridanum TaxID=29053 RepID=UPI0006C9855E|nr:probable salivary secreted peptide [Copidosoma floridanum]